MRAMKNKANIPGKETNNTFGAGAVVRNKAWALKETGGNKDR